MATIITTITWPQAGAHLGKLDRLVRCCQMDCLALPQRTRPSIGPYRPTMAATKRGPRRGAAGRCGDRSGLIPARATTSRATGSIGAGRGLRESAPWSCGRTTSERSSVNKTANGSSSRAMTAMRFAPALARSQVRMRSGGVDCPPIFESKGPPRSRAALF